jgi:hypothetical protein
VSDMSAGEWVALIGAIAALITALYYSLHGMIKLAGWMYGNRVESLEKEIEHRDELLAREKEKRTTLEDKYSTLELHCSNLSRRIDDLTRTEPVKLNQAQLAILKHFDKCYHSTPGARNSGLLPKAFDHVDGVVHEHLQYDLLCLKNHRLIYQGTHVDTWIISELGMKFIREYPEGEGEI